MGLDDLMLDEEIIVDAFVCPVLVFEMMMPRYPAGVRRNRS